MPPSIKDIARQIKDQTDIVGVIGRYVTLKRAGRSFKGLCPFHDEKTPSFTVNPDTGYYKCYGCDAGGTVIDFIMGVERLEFIDALKQLAKELGIEVPERDGPAPEIRDRVERQRRSLESLNEFAHQWFRQNLLQGRNDIARRMVQDRGISAEMVEKFQLGAALPGWDHFLRAASERGFSEELLIQADLCVHREERGTVYDRFRNRVIFPIFDHLGRVMGFGGRRLDDDDPAKYLNSAETPLYKKGRTLYALNVAKDAIRESGYAILTEGYMDTLMAHQYGFGQAVASLGTALTPEQARLLKRFAERVYFLYDGDDAGQKAMLKAGPPLLGADLDVRVIVLPAEDDPDSFLRREGPQALEKRRQEAREYIDFALSAYARDLELQTIAGQTAMVERTAPLLLAIRNEFAREAAITRLLGWLGGLPKQTIYRVLEKKSRAQHRGTPPRTEVSPAGPADRDPLDWFVLKLMVRSYEALQVFRRTLSETWLRDPTIEPWIFYFMYGEDDARHLIAEAEMSMAPPGPMPLIAEALVESDPIGDPVNAAEQLVARLRRRYHQVIASQIIKSIAEMPEELELSDKTLNTIHEQFKLASETRIPSAPINVI